MALASCLNSISFALSYPHTPFFSPLPPVGVALIHHYFKRSSIPSLPARTLEHLAEHGLPSTIATVLTRPYYILAHHFCFHRKEFMHRCRAVTFVPFFTSSLSSFHLVSLHVVRHT